MFEKAPHAITITITHDVSALLALVVQGTDYESQQCKERREDLVNERERIKPRFSQPATVNQIKFLIHLKTLRKEAKNKIKLYKNTFLTNYQLMIR